MIGGNYPTFALGFRMTVRFGLPQAQAFFQLLEESHWHESWLERIWDDGPGSKNTFTQLCVLLQCKLAHVKKGKLLHSCEYDQRYCKQLTVNKANILRINFQTLTL